MRPDAPDPGGHAAGSVSLQHIAERVGLHKTTIQRALAGDARVQAATAARIRAVADALGYDPDVNLAARRLAALRCGGRRVPAKLIATVMTSAFFRSPYFARQFSGVLEVLGEAGYDLLLRFSDQLGERALPAPMLRGDVDAVIAIAHEEWLGGMVARLRAAPAFANRPIVSLINRVADASAVTADFRGGGRLATAHLLDLGHRRILAFDWWAFQTEERLAGCRAACRERCLDPQRALHVVSPDRRLSDREACYAEALDRGLADAPDATALMAPNDAIARTMIRLLTQRGRPVPAAMSVIGFDDTDPLPGADGRNLLSSIALPLEDIGRAAAQRALAPRDERAVAVLPVSLRVRETTAPPP